ncbi:SGNH/GDSL hydrolase family protein [Flavobacterium eburneipallidum]|uniref:SGNH/GDSL hydrolase family protein n=1 Tax=Flavobacterium eburneipallidum TaxID=3003263 RepID=UPI002482A365|nr:SGNH/GDSL hydrolase family protein [Flavobacterium eburneipallidum]
MRTILILLMSFFFLATITSCSSENPSAKSETNPIVSDSSPEVLTQSATITYLALGDSYTIGQSVCESCRFPEQLIKSLKNLNGENNFSVEIIARTGWTTTNLINAIDQQKPSNNYDLVTLLIGVNNQYQGVNFSVYEKEFPELITKAIGLAKGDKTRLIVVSIPDYAYTPFGQSFGNPASISTEIDRYNTFAKSYCQNNGILFINITDITRNGLNNPILVANDGLHPSETAYYYFVERMVPKAVAILKK